METWSAHHLFDAASEKLGESIANDLVQYSAKLRDQRLPVIFSLRHLAKVVDSRYWFLHETVNRMRESSNYRMYRIRKRSGGFRWIHSVASELLKVQSWLNRALLQNCIPHPCSYAFHSNGGIRSCAAAHCGAKWLFQFDLQDFFYNISEIDCFRVFRALGYRKLVSFELARLCTTRRLPAWCPRAKHHGYGYQEISIDDIEHYGLHDRVMYDYGPHSLVSVDKPRSLPYVERFGRLGALPQGAPSSPMLANLVARRLDDSLHSFARENGMVYTRYADDITLSTTKLRKDRGSVQRHVIGIIRKHGFAEKKEKCRIAGPGSKKLILGLLVDGDHPRISRETYKRIDRLLHGVERFGFASTAEHFGFESAYGFHNHLSGLIAFVKSVETKRWEEFKARLSGVKAKWKGEDDA